MPPQVIWVIDTSSVAEVRRSVANTQKPHVFSSMSSLVAAGRLVYPKQLVDELRRYADPDAPDAQYLWAKQEETRAANGITTMEELKTVLAAVPKVLDPDKDAGADEADPYVLAMAVRLRLEGKDARVITQEKHDTPKKVSLRTAAGLLGVPAVPLQAFLEFEGIL